MYLLLNKYHVIKNMFTKPMSFYLSLRYSTHECIKIICLVETKWLYPAGDKVEQKPGEQYTKLEKHKNLSLMVYYVLFFILQIQAEIFWNEILVNWRLNDDFLKLIFTDLSPDKKKRSYRRGTANQTKTIQEFYILMSWYIFVRNQFFLWSSRNS